MKLISPFKKEDIMKLNAGDVVYISGTIYTARDQAHQRLLIDKPGFLKDSIIYYTGPSPKKDEYPIGSCGPTSSYRMDKYFNQMIDLGSLGAIGKGERSQEVIEACKDKGAVYFICQGGLGALISSYIKKSELIMYPDLMAEAVYKLEVKDFKVVVAYDSKGNSVYKK